MRFNVFGFLPSLNTRIMQNLRVVALLWPMGAILSGCPLAGQNTASTFESIPETAASFPSGGAQKNELDVYWGDQEVKDSDYFRRRVFFNGHEVHVHGSYKAPAEHREHLLEIKQHIISRLRMLFKDPKSFNIKPCLDPQKDLFLCFLQNIFGFGNYTVTRVILNVTRVEVLPADQQAWQPVVDFGASGQLIDLMGLSQGTFFELGTFNLAPGSYTKMRLNLGTGSKVEVDEGHGRVMKHLATSTGAQEYVDLVSAFSIPSSGLTTLTIDFDVSDSIKRKLNGTYWMKPNLKINSVSTNNSISKTIKAEDGGVLGIFGEVVLTIPPGALDADTQITLTPVQRLAPHTTANLLLLGQEYLIAPADIIFNTPVTLSLAFDARYVPSLAVNADTLDIYWAASGSRQWLSAGGGSVKDGTLLTSFLNQTGRIVVGAEPEMDEAWGEAGCDEYTDAVQVQLVKAGLDLQYFAKSCNHHRSCYEHGYRTYLKEAEACDYDLAAETMQQCEALCRDGSLFGKDCKLVTAEEFVQKHADGFSAGLYETCKVLASNIAAEARQAQADRFPGNDRSTCSDYDGRGVSCAPAVCTVAADKSSIKSGIPTDIVFTVSLQGSIFAADFDSTAIYRHEGYATPIQQTFTVTETGRILTEPRVFVAAVSGPGGFMSCQTQVDVIHTPDPCTLAIAPSSVTAGQLAGLTLVAGPGYDTAYVDVNQAGAMQAVGLQAPGEDGTRKFFANLRPRSSRTFTARVIHTSGEEHSCTADIIVLP